MPDSLLIFFGPDLALQLVVPVHVAHAHGLRTSGGMHQCMHAATAASPQEPFTGPRPGPCAQVEMYPSKSDRMTFGGIPCAQVEMYPSKSDGMFVRESLIFRSDSNGEDLEGYAGAGLYDSITMDTTELRKVDYAADRRAQHLFAHHEQACGLGRV